MASGSGWVDPLDPLPVEVLYKEDNRTVSFGPKELTTKNLAKVFGLIADTIYLQTTTAEHTVKFPNADGGFSDIDELHRWEVLGVKSSQGRAGSAALGDLPGPSTSSQATKWKPKHYRSATGGVERKQGLQPPATWQKSIQICEVRNDQVVEIAEHPLTLSENIATVEEVSGRLREEAFQGNPIKLLNAKNLALPDCDGTRGAKFWKTSKTIKAVLEDDYNELELSRSSGTARARRPKSTTYIHISSGSDSDSPGLPLTRTRRQPFTGCSRPPLHQTIVTEHHIQAIVSKIDSNTEILRTIQGKVMTWSPPASSCNPTVRDILTCIICKMASTDPLVPKCCNSVLVCRECLQEWLQSSKTCPHCREDILSISDCVQFPLIRPLLNII